MDKRHVYDWDTRVPFVIRGPGIPPASSFAEPATLVDLAPTFLSLAGVATPRPAMDGRSLLPLLVDETNRTAWAQLPSATRAHLTSTGPSAAVRAGWRDAVLLSHYFFTENIKCVGLCSTCSIRCSLRTTMEC